MAVMETIRRMVPRAAAASKLTCEIGRDRGGSGQIGRDRGARRGARTWPVASSVR
jgi:hypothetical protein